YVVSATERGHLRSASGGPRRAAALLTEDEIYRAAAGASQQICRRHDGIRQGGGFLRRNIHHRRETGVCLPWLAPAQQQRRRTSAHELPIVGVQGEASQRVGAGGALHHQIGLAGAHLVHDRLVVRTVAYGIHHDIHTRCFHGLRQGLQI